jgi:hypothetical protein
MKIEIYNQCTRTNPIRGINIANGNVAAGRIGKIKIHIKAETW